MYQIAIANSQDCLELDEDFLVEVAQRVLAEEEVAAAEISVALIDDQAIHELNRQYLGHDYATDVLSFLLDSEPPEDEPPGSDLPSRLRGKGKRLDGEVIISTETAARDAKYFGWSPREEVVLYLIHGLLHLVGYDDLTSTEQTIMRARERAILALFDITPPPSPGQGESTGSPTALPDAESEDPERPPGDSSSSSWRTES